MDLDGVILSGGDNIGDFPERDRTEDEILKFVIKIVKFGQFWI